MCSHDPNVLTLPFLGTPANICINIISPETRDLLNICTADNTGLSLFMSMQLSSKATISQTQHAGEKIEFNVKWLFKVIQG